MDNENRQGDATAIIDAVKAFHAPQIIDMPGELAGVGHSLPLLLRPGADGFSADSLKRAIDEWRERPERMRGTTRLDTAQSLIDHAKRFRNDQSVLFCNADPEKPTIRAIYNFDDAVQGDVGLADAAAADWNDHVGFYPMPLSEEWRVWSGADGKPMDQAAFAAFLEDHILDVMPFDAEAGKAPIVQALGGHLAGAEKVMALSRGVQVFVANETETRVNLSSGEAKLVATEEHRDGKGDPVNIPNLFRIAIPVFEQGTPVPVFVRLRYRLARGSVSWTVLMHDRSRLFGQAVREAAAHVASETGLPLFYGGLTSGPAA